jgi:hypothetical protein
MLKISKITSQFSNTLVFDGHTETLPTMVRDKLGISTRNGDFVMNKRIAELLLNEPSMITRFYSGEKTSLTSLNDLGVSFKTIARIIEMRPKGLFA